MGSKPYKKLTLFGCAVTISALTACSNSKWQEVAPKTGDPIAESQLPPVAPQVKKGDELTIIPDRVLGRTVPNQPIEDTPITLERGDKVRVTDPNPKGKEGYIEVVVVDTRSPNKPEKPILLPTGTASPDPVKPTPQQDAADRYFMIQNVATEKSRIYENCVEKKADGSCVHRLVLESEMVAGEDTPSKDRRTLLGSFRITQWFKFYQDKEDHYPSFYAPGFPKLPDEGASFKTWLSPRLLPEGKGRTRGTFGWYTAQLGPNANEQWTHGTFGWGDDADKFILATRDAKLNDEMDPRSEGCTRVENRAIAFAREILAKGAKVIRVYAKEGYRDESLARYKDQPERKWNWVLTKDGVNSPAAPKASAAVVAQTHPTDNDVLDSGTFHLDQTPSAVPFTNTGNAKTTQNGNLYSVPVDEMKGAFLVDEGTLVGYEHPKSLRVGGHADRKIPTTVLSNDTNYKLAQRKEQKRTKREILDPQPAPGRRIQQ